MRISIDTIKILADLGDKESKRIYKLFKADNWGVDFFTRNGNIFHVTG